MRRFAIPAAALAAILLLPAAASAGGWATVGLSSLPEGKGPGDPWVVDITVLQHGRTPLAGVQPTVEIRSDAGATQTFAARPTAKTGVYRARVVFPSAGRWDFSVDDGFSQTHGFAPVRISEGSAPAAPTARAAAPTAPVEVPAPAGGDGPWLWLVLGAVVALAGLAAGWGMRRRRPTTSGASVTPS